MPEPVRLGRFLKVTVTGEVREGFCQNCRTQTVKEFYMDGERKRVRMVCPKCGGMGRLIVKTTAIQAPPAPQCLRPKCLFHFFRQVLLCGLLASYHRRRVAYATHNRNKKMAERYRTGSPSPHTICQVIFENIKLLFLGGIEWLKHKL